MMAYAYPVSQDAMYRRQRRFISTFNVNSWIAARREANPESTEGRREDSGRVGEGATEEVAGLHLG